MKIFTVTLNPAYDIHYTVEDFRPFAENYASGMQTDCGGKGINISSLLNTLGVENIPYVVTADENGEAFNTFLQKNMPSSKIFRTEGRIRENITIHAAGKAETRISLDTFTLREDVFKALCSELESEAKSGSIVAFAGRIPKGTDKRAVISFLKRLRDKGVYTVIDSNSLSLSEYIEASPWFIKPNEQEAGAFATIRSREDALDAAIKIHKCGIENVMISLGGDGCAFASEELSILTKAPKVNAISTIGAGDSTVAGFIAAFAQNMPLKACVHYALCCGSAACTTAGTNPPDKAVIDALISQI